METKEVIKKGENYHIGKAVLTPQLLEEIEALQLEKNFLLVANKETIAAAMSEILINSDPIMTNDNRCILVGLANIYKDYDSFINPLEII